MVRYLVWKTQDGLEKNQKTNKGGTLTWHPRVPNNIIIDKILFIQKEIKDP